jgi:glycine dehydrogenase
MLHFSPATEEFKRAIPGRIIGVSVDVYAQGNSALTNGTANKRATYQKRKSDFSNICTAQALLANMAAMYAVYHGAGRYQTNIATRVCHT